MKKIKKKAYRFWKASERVLIEHGIVPEGRTVHACRTFCSRNGIPFPGVEELDTNRRILERYKDD